MTMDKLAKKLLESGCNSELERVRAAWIWVTDNIEYDITFRMSNHSPQSVLDNGLAVCQGYSDVNKELLERLGVKALTVSG